MKGWYKYATDRPRPPACVTIEQMTVEWVALYWKVPPPWEEGVPVAIDPFLVDEFIPSEAEVEWAMPRLQ